MIAVACTGIAATLLTGGATYHSQFKIYPPITETTTSKIETHHNEAQKTREACLVISDEATIKLNHSLNAIDQLLRRTMRKKVKFFCVVEIFGNVFQLLGMATV